MFLQSFIIPCILIVTVLGSPVSRLGPVETDHTYALSRMQNIALTKCVYGFISKEHRSDSPPKTLAADDGYESSFTPNEETTAIMRCLGRCINRAFPVQPDPVENVLDSRRNKLSKIQSESEIIDLCGDSCFSEYTDAVSPLEVEGLSNSANSGSPSHNMDSVDLTGDSDSDWADNGSSNSKPSPNDIVLNDSYMPLVQQMTLEDILDNYECIPEDYLNIMYDQLVLSEGRTEEGS